MNLQQMARSLQTLSPALAARVWRFQRRVALEIHSELATFTPVDTGQAISNWQMSVGTPRNTTLPPYVPGVKGSTDNQNIRAAIAQGRAATSGVIAPVIHIVNNANHIGALNNGHSKQAPAQFIERAIAYGARVAASKGF